MSKDRGQAGFTLIEILIVVSILGILVAMVAPTLSGFLGLGASQGYTADSNTIQAASDAYYTTTGATYRKYPTISGLASNTVPTTTTGTNVIGFDYLVTANLLRQQPTSAGTLNGGTGSYSWYVRGNGVVSSTPIYSAGVYP